MVRTAAAGPPHLLAHQRLLPRRNEAAARRERERAHDARVAREEALRAVNERLDDHRRAERVHEVRAVRVPLQAILDLAWREAQAGGKRGGREGGGGRGLARRRGLWRPRRAREGRGGANGASARAAARIAAPPPPLRASPARKERTREANYGLELERGRTRRHPRANKKILSNEYLRAAAAANFDSRRALPTHKPHARAADRGRALPRFTLSPP